MSCPRRMYWICCGRSLLQDEKLPIRKAIEEAAVVDSSSKSVTKYWSSKILEAPEIISIDSEKEKFSNPKRAPGPDWVIGLDFGTTYSGFAYAKATDDPRIFLHYDWPQGKRAEKPYCKTLTGLFYKRDEATGHLKCASWGHPARSDHMDPGRQQGSLYLTTFKMLLKKDLNDPALVRSMPPSLTPTDIIADYLKLISENALSVVERHAVANHGQFRKDAVQWYLTVPSIWDENAKLLMKTCMVNAGLVTSGSVDAVQVVLEPEAASFYCHQVLRERRKGVFLNTKDKILVADVGGGTVDIVVQEMVGNSDNYKVKELTESSGGLCGGTFVDQSFLRFLSQRVPCLQEFLRQNPAYKTRLLKDWEEIKSAFGHEKMSSSDTKDIQLPDDLAAKWEAACENLGHECDDDDYFSVVELTEEDLKAIFDPVVDDILELIAAQLTQVRGIKVMFVVGGFAGSPYLMQRIRARFAGEVTHIVSPPSPGTAIVQGAVSLALHPDAIVESRVSRKR